MERRGEWEGKGDGERGKECRKERAEGWIGAREGGEKVEKGRQGPKEVRPTLASTENAYWGGANYCG